MVRYMPAVLVAALILIAGCAGTFTGPAAETPTEPATSPLVALDGVDAQPTARQLSGGVSSAAGESGTITVSGTGQVSTAPDRALVSVTVQARADTADAARGQVATDVSRMRDALRDAEVPDDDVRTTHYRVSSRYDYTDERQELIGYVATHSFEIQSSVDRAGEVVDTAVGNGADQVSSVRFTLTDETQRELRERALTDAVSTARADADAIATATGVTITGVHSASTGGPVVIPYAGQVAEAADGGRTTFDTGPVTVTAYVTIAYTIE